MQWGAGLKRGVLNAALGWLAAIGPIAAGDVSAASASTDASATTTARVIVRYRSEGSLQRAQAQRALAESLVPARSAPRHAAVLSQRLGLALTDGRAISPRAQVLFAAGLDSEALAERLRQDPDVESAVPDRRRHRAAVPNDPLYPDGLTATTPAVGQWYLRGPTARVLAAIDAAGAWDITTGVPSVVVAVLDTGVRFDHPDLAGRFFAGSAGVGYGYDFIADGFTANDGDGRDADASDPGDWVTAVEASADPANCSEDTSSWHGTQVSGLIGAATDNAIGMAGVARGAMLLPVRVLGKCGGFDSDIQAAMRWAAGLHVDGVPDNQHPAQILNMSLGGIGACDAASGYPDVIAELTAAGASVVAAAGNGVGQAVGLPANCPGVIAVTGLRHIGTKVGFSNIGPEVAVAAPGGNCVNVPGTCLYPLLTTTNIGSRAPAASIYSDSFNTSLGTSFAAPLVAGTAALLLSADAGLTPARLRSLLQASARPFPSRGAADDVRACRAPDGSRQDECYCTTTTCGAGMLDAAASLTLLSRPVARVTTTPAAPVAGSPLTLDAASSAVPPGRSRAGVQWTLVDGGGIVSLAAGADTALQLTFTPNGTGQFVVDLVVRDDTGATSAPTRLTVAVGEVAPAVAQNEGGGGGGALSMGWLCALAAAVLLLNRRKESDEVDT